MKCNIYEQIHTHLLKQSDQFCSLHEIIKNNGIIKIPKNEITFFDFLVKTIISQQISSKAADSIWTKITKILQKESICLLDFLSLPKKALSLKKIGISKQKYNYIQNIHEKILTNGLNESDLGNLNFEKIKERLIKYKGVGEWTCNMIGIFYFQEKNIWPKNDLIIKKTSGWIQKKENQEINFEIIFRPYLSVLALHFWKHSD